MMPRLHWITDCYLLYFPLALLLIGILLNFTFTYSDKGFSKYVCVLLLIFSVTYVSGKEWVNHFNNGSGYTGSAFTNYGNVIKRELSNEPVLKTFSNGPDLIRLYKDSYIQLERIPFTIDPNTRLKNTNFANDVKGMIKEIENGEAQLLYFDKIDWRGYLMSREDVLNSFKQFEVEYNDNGFLIRKGSMQPMPTQ